ncbi:MAG TPA: phage portal protein [Phycisphaerae bacterium]|nr:phage portal protein [Phycisphaerae bacterium]
MWPFRRKRKTRESLPAVLRAGSRLPLVMRARYDAAQTTADSARHWAMADALSADSAMSADVRRKLRQNARYEVANNSYAKGIVLTLANDCVGTGPRLQLLTSDGKLNNRVEEAFADWCRAVSLAAKLRTMRAAKATDGETFAVLTANPLIDSPVMLDVQLVEADRVAAPWRSLADSASDIDGITFDAWGNPGSYAILRQHPGDLLNWTNEFDLVDAAAVIHWFREDRPGQHRGVPEITPALPLFAQLRRYTLAVLAAAETAADFAAVLFTDSPANGEAQALEPMDVVELEKRMATVLPDGWRLGQIEAQQPTTSYADFKRELLNEIARCLNMPFNVAAGNSAGYNYSSGRLDHQTYYKSIRVEQAHLAEAVLDRILEAWLDEAALTEEFAILRTVRSMPHQWFFDGAEHVDPAKEANAQATRLTSNTTTLAIEYARQGRDWETELHQRAKEKKLMKELGLVEESDPPAEPENADDEEEEAEPDVEARRAA